MSQRTLTIELEEAARLKIFGQEDSDYVASFGTPGANTVALPNSAGFEKAYVSVEPLAGAPWAQTVDFGGRSEASINGQLANAPKLLTSGQRPSVAATASSMAPSSPKQLSPFFWTANPTEAASEAPAASSAASCSALRSQPRRFSFGLSTDAKPLSYGGWRPYVGPWPAQVTETKEQLQIEIMRSATDAVAPESGFRVRATVSAERAFVERYLMPLYGGGVRVAISADDPGCTPRCQVRPLDPDRYALQQAVEAGSDEEGKIVWSQFSARHDIETYVNDGSVFDPWTVLLALMANDRFRSISLPRPQEWCGTMAKRFDWISDFHILEAHYAIKKSTGRQNARKVLNLLSRARRIGAPYFSGSNRILLAALSSLANEESGNNLASDARAEMARWWRTLDNQSAAGVLFSWRMDNGIRSSGRQDRRFATIVAQGTISDGIIRHKATHAAAIDAQEKAEIPVLRVTLDPTPQLDLEPVDKALRVAIAKDASLVLQSSPDERRRVLKGPTIESLAEALATLPHLDHRVAHVIGPEVIYKETITQAAEITYTHKVQAARSGEFARVTIRFEPGAPGSGIQFFPEALGLVPKEFIPGVEEGLRIAAERGLTTTFPVTDFAAHLVDGTYHDVDSSVRAFEIAAQRAFEQLTRHAAPVVLEPIMKFEATASGKALSWLTAALGGASAQAGDSNRILVGYAALVRLLAVEERLSTEFGGLAKIAWHYDHYGPKTDLGDTGVAGGFKEQAS